MKKNLISVLLASSCLSFNAAAELEEVVVTAELIDTGVLELPNSVSVIEQSQIDQRQAYNLEDLLNLAPNINYATGASRGRFIQIRGIGERSEFQDPIINSVGVVLDGIDMTGIATGASTLDLAQVEVLRGPQGTLFGANALAGMINMVSNRPTDTFTSRLSLGVADYGGQLIQGMLSGPLNDSLGYRIAAQNVQSDGFVENVFLNRNDTMRIDESTARAQLAWQANTDLAMNFTLFLADIDNGYDAFSLDNTRQTYSDEPGVDQQDTVAGSVRASYAITEQQRLEAMLSVANSDLTYSYDEDWSYPGICDGTACDSALFGFDWFYASFDAYQRDNDNTSVDLRYVSEGDQLSWVAGVYHRDQSIKLTRDYTYNDGLFHSQFDTQNSAIYGQLNYALNDRWAVIGGLRSEYRDVDYADSDLAQASLSEDLWGGRLALEYRTDRGAFVYGLISRGFKPGGFNLDQDLDADKREYETETMLNYELGFKHYFDALDLQVQAAVFYQDRDAIQTKQSVVRSIATGVAGDPCPCGFTDFTDNAASGTNRGLEVELNWAPSERWSVYSTLGLLDTEFDQLLTFDHVNADRDNGIPFNLAGREQAHAPSYQWLLGGNLQLAENWSIHGSLEGKDDFYFSDRHELRSEAYTLANLELAYTRDNLRVALYGKNLGDETITTRGFGSFGNDPRKFYETEPYTQYGAPRVVGLRATIDF